MTRSNKPAQEPIRGHKAGFQMKDGYSLSWPAQVIELAKKGFKIEYTNSGIFISKYKHSY
jgi:hypothetical protein